MQAQLGRSKERPPVVLLFFGLLASSCNMWYIRNMSNTGINDVDRLTEIFAALSNPYRLRIFLRLALGCQQSEGRDEDAAVPRGTAPCVGELVQALDIAPSTVSHHLKELRQAGLIRMDRAGQRVRCLVERSALVELAGFFAQVLDG